MSEPLTRIAAQMARREGGCERGHRAGTWHVHEGTVEAWMRALLAILDAERARPAIDVARCPAGCGCRLWSEDADAADCGCDGPCCWDSWDDFMRDVLDRPAYYRETFLASHDNVRPFAALAAAPAPALDVDRLREAARRARLPRDVTVADIENLAAEYDRLAALTPAPPEAGR